MTAAQQIIDNIFSVIPTRFNDLALFVFRHQYNNNVIYRQWVNLLGIQVNNVHTVQQIPFLPVSFFKTHRVVAGDFEPDCVFESSGTSGTINSKHFVKDKSLYFKSFQNGFKHFFGDVKEWCIIGLLPSYLERNGSSLVVMVDNLIQSSENPQSGFFLYDFDHLAAILKERERKKQKTLVIGVTFALLDFAEKFPMRLERTTMVETGGMKGRRRELIRKEVHDVLKRSFCLSQVQSEYGMTELLSQSYSLADGIFNCVPWKKVLVRDEDDPFVVSDEGKGIINVIDLANIHSCSFIATDDVGKLYRDGRFEVLGRMDASDVRGCSLMVL